MTLTAFRQIILHVDFYDLNLKLDKIYLKEIPFTDKETIQAFRAEFKNDYIQLLLTYSSQSMTTFISKNEKTFFDITNYLKQFNPSYPQKDLEKHTDETEKQHIIRYCNLIYGLMQTDLIDVIQGNKWISVYDDWYGYRE